MNQRESDIKHQPLRTRQLVFIFDQLAHLLEAKVPLIDALEWLTSSTHQSSADALIAGLNREIRQGRSLGAALNAHANWVGHDLGPLIQGAERTGTTAIALRSWVSLTQKTLNQKSRIIKAVTYPMVIILVALFAFIGMLVWVIPQFETLFTNFDVVLPWVTQCMIGLSTWLRESAQALIIGCLVLIAWLFVDHTTRHWMRDRALRCVLAYPSIGRLSQQQWWALIAKRLALFLDRGMTINEALMLIADTLSDSQQAQKLHQVATDLTKGLSLSKAIARLPTADPSLIFWIGIGEKTGQLGDTLNRAGNLLENNVNDHIDRLSQRLEPFMMITVGMLVGLMLLALYLPMFQLTAVSM